MLGPLRDFTLDEARARARRARQQLRDGVDPLEVRKAERAAQALESAKAKAKTFEQAAKQYFDGHESQWTNAHYRQKFLSSLGMYAFPVIGKLPVSAIDTDLVLQVIEPIWKTKPDTANRVRGRIENILEWAKVRGLRVGDNPAKWAGHLEEALPAKTRVTQHHAALPYAAVPAFVAKLANQSGVAPKAMEFLILTAARSGEAIGARWEEIDFAKKLWTVPAQRMKQRRPHRVPLTDRAIEILRMLPREGDYVFIGARTGQLLGKNSFFKLVESMGFDGVTTHGMRSSFRDFCAERTSFPREVIEAALAHAVGDATEAAYLRSHIIAWSLWRRAHQAQARRAHLKKKAQL
jgi:integrase